MITLISFLLLLVLMLDIINLAMLEQLVSAEGLFLWQPQPEKRMEERNIGEDQSE